MFGHMLSLVRSHLVTLAAFALFGLSGGMLFGSCYEQCLTLQFMMMPNAYPPDSCVEFQDPQAMYALTTPNRLGRRYTGTHNWQRDRDTCINCSCDVGQDHFWGYHGCLAAASETNGSWSRIDNFECYEDL